MSAGLRRKRLGPSALLLCAMAYAALAPAATIDALRAAGDLEIDASLTPQSDIVPGQKLTLTLKIATDRWFSGGTRITLPEVPGLVILQTEQFASNASEQRGESNWVIQRWNLDIYPQRPGDFSIPPVKARLRVNTADGDVEGVLSSPGMQFTVGLPTALAGVEQWVAAPAFTVNQQFDRSLEGLQPGDAFERVVTFEASDVMAMMLPSLPPEDNPGLAAYPAPPVLDDSNNRGQVSASRRERISYVVQAEGRYLLRARDFHWWDTTRGELRLVSLPAVEITVGSGVAGEVPDGPALPRLSPRQWLVIAAGLIGLGLLLWLGWRYLPRLPPGTVSARVTGLRQTLRELRKPALAERLNPGSNAGE